MTEQQQGEQQQDEFDASGFDDDLEDLAGQAKAADATTGFARHPRGKWAGVIGDITKKDVRGQALWEIEVATEKGIGVFTVWGFKPGEAAAAKAKAAAGDTKDLERTTKTIARYKRIFTDLGLPEPQGWANGPDSVIGSLGKLSGKACTLVVQEDRRDANKDAVFLNAPAGKAGLASQEASPPSVGQDDAPPYFGAPPGGDEPPLPF